MLKDFVVAAQEAVDKFAVDANSIAEQFSEGAVSAYELAAKINANASLAEHFIETAQWDAVGDVSISTLKYDDALKERLAIADASFAAKSRLNKVRGDAMVKLFAVAGIY